MKRFFFILFFIGIVLGAVSLFNLFLFIHTPFGQEQTLVIEPGMTVHEVLSLLEEKKVISNKILFKIYVRLRGSGGKIRAGEYHFVGERTPSQILTELLEGDFSRLRITIPEGWTAQEIANYLGGLNLVTADDFLKLVRDPLWIQGLSLSYSTLEGFLYPDTYEIYKPKEAGEARLDSRLDSVDPRRTARQVIRKMVGRFWEVYDASFQQRAREIGLTDYEVIILASLVEKETGQAEERPLIASVFYNRLRFKMPLASDPSIIYGIENFSGNLTRADLDRPGPYNTYLNPGLPPTPICNPGRDSLRAVLYPPETSYLYFVSKNDGTHHFSKSIEEHGAAVRRYQLKGQ